MAGGHHYYGGKKRKKGGGGWLFVLFCILFAALLRYGQSQPLIHLRQQVSTWMSESEPLQQAASQVGKLFAGEGDASIQSVFGQLFFGQEQAEE